MHARHYVLIAFAILVQPACGRVQGERLTVTKDPSDASRTICDVQFATFRVPIGWMPNGSSKNSYAILSRSGETYPNLTKVITIDIGKPARPTAAESAEWFATKWRGQVESATLTVDGEEAFRVTIPPNETTMGPIDCVIAMRNERLFMLIGAAKETGELNTALDEVVATWKWNN